jgi:Zn finger protein HypA/HybF involved in hydrogenase expression
MNIQCWCHTCHKDHFVPMFGIKVPYSRTLMILCPKCRNKRCPHANDHNNACTNSNDTGQPGSAYP